MIRRRLALLLLAPLAVAAAGSAAASSAPEPAGYRSQSTRLPGAEARPDRTDDRAHGAHRPALGSVDEMHLGVAGERVRRSRSSVRLPLRRARWNRIGPQARACHRQEKGRPPSQHGPVRVLSSQGLPLTRNRTDPAGYPGGAGHRRPRQAAAIASACAPHEPGSARETVRGTREERGAPGADGGAVRRVGVVPVLDPGDRVRRPGGALRLPLSGQGRRAGLSARACDRPQRVGRPRLHVLGR